ncbi:MAG: hypothetical protein ACJ754_19660 [Pyrinomonadaceae bacterium]
MKEERPDKLQRLKPQEPATDPLDLMYAGLGYLGVWYESQLVFIKHEMEKEELSERDEELVQSLQAVHVLGVELFSRLFARQPPSENVLRAFHQSTAQAMKHLAHEGKRFVEQIEEGRNKP